MSTESPPIVTFRLRRSTMWLWGAVVCLLFTYGVLLRLGTGNGAAPGVRVNDVVIDAARVRELRQALAREGAAAVSEQAVLDALIDEELLFQAAAAQGWVNDDVAVRRRLVQRMLEAVAASVGQPTEQQVRDFYAQHVSDFMPPATIRFEQLYIPVHGDAGDGQALREASAVLQRANDITAFTQLAAAWPDRLRLHDPNVYYPRNKIAEVYGPRFAALLFEAETNRATGPYLSSLGAHVVWVHEVRRQAAPSLPEVRTAVLDAWRRQRIAEETAVLLARLREQADIELVTQP